MNPTTTSFDRPQEGDTVTVAFQGFLDDGSPFGGTEDNDPLTFRIGRDEVLPGLEKAVSNMLVGEQKTVAVPPEEGYGLRKPDLVEEVPLSILPEGLDLRIGNQLEVTTARGQKLRVRIVRRNEQSIVLDANHPLAGQTLTFHLELVAIERPTIN
ncbi:MAG: peptidylprolyl isomerase [Desulfuromonadales bacterium]|nr:peptidylprolyl isomerase [Desulfuromonadales bacterium]